MTHLNHTELNGIQYSAVRVEFNFNFIRFSTVYTAASQDVHEKKKNTSKICIAFTADQYEKCFQAGKMKRWKKYRKAVR